MPLRVALFLGGIRCSPPWKGSKMLLVERNTLGRTGKSMKEAKRDPCQRLTIRELTTEDFIYAAVGIALSLCKLEMGSAESTSIAQCISSFTCHVVQL